MGPELCLNQPEEKSLNDEDKKRYQFITGTVTYLEQCCVFCSPGALTFGYGCTVHVGVDVGAGDIEVDVIYISFITSVQYTGYLVPYKEKVQKQVDN